MQKRRGETAGRGRRRRRSENGHWRQAIALTFAGTALVGAFAVAGYQVGNVAAARSVAPVEVDVATDPAGTGLRKGSLIAATPLVEPEASLTEQAIPASLVSAKSDSLFETITTERSDRLRRMISPPVALIEKSWRIGRERRHRVAEHACLARAIYFEARSEPELGRLAVAKVILNRVKSPLYPDTICEVVYQNSARRHACQFSFTCDGKSDTPRRGRAWEQAKTIAARAIAGDGDVQVVAAATSYHADYVLPEWSGAMTRLIKIGRHIFYSGS